MVLSVCLGLSSAWPYSFGPFGRSAPVQNECSVLDASPFFKSSAVVPASEDMEAAVNFGREAARKELVFLTEFSRFMNKKVPILLQVKLHWFKLLV